MSKAQNLLNILEMDISLHKQKAYSMGMEASKNGKKRDPFKDIEFVNILRSLSKSDTKEVKKSWFDGFDQ